MDKFSKEGGAEKHEEGNDLQEASDCPTESPSAIFGGDSSPEIIFKRVAKKYERKAQCTGRQLERTEEAAAGSNNCRRTDDNLNRNASNFDNGQDNYSRSQGRNDEGHRFAMPSPDGEDKRRDVLFCHPSTGQVDEGHKQQQPRQPGLVRGPYPDHVRFVRFARINSQLFHVYNNGEVVPADNDYLAQVETEVSIQNSKDPKRCTDAEGRSPTAQIAESESQLSREGNENRSAQQDLVEFCRYWQDKCEVSSTSQDRSTDSSTSQDIQGQQVNPSVSSKKVKVKRSKKISVGEASSKKRKNSKTHLSSMKIHASGNGKLGVNDNQPYNGSYPLNHKAESGLSPRLSSKTITPTVIQSGQHAMRDIFPSQAKKDKRRIPRKAPVGPRKRANSGKKLTDKAVKNYGNQTEIDAEGAGQACVYSTTAAHDPNDNFSHRMDQSFMQTSIDSSDLNSRKRCDKTADLLIHSKNYRKEGVDSTTRNASRTEGKIKQVRKPKKIVSHKQLPVGQNVHKRMALECGKANASVYNMNMKNVPPYATDVTQARGKKGSRTKEKINAKKISDSHTLSNWAAGQKFEESQLESTAFLQETDVVFSKQRTSAVNKGNLSKFAKSENDACPDMIARDLSNSAKIRSGDGNYVKQAHKIVKRKRKISYWCSVSPSKAGHKTNLLSDGTDEAVNQPIRDIITDAPNVQKVSSKKHKPFPQTSEGDQQQMFKMGKSVGQKQHDVGGKINFNTDHRSSAVIGQTGIVPLSAERSAKALTNRLLYKKSVLDANNIADKKEKDIETRGKSIKKINFDPVCHDEYNEIPEKNLKIRQNVPAFKKNVSNGRESFVLDHPPNSVTNIKTESQYNEIFDQSLQFRGKQCDMCFKKFPTGAALKRHKNEARETDAYCIICRIILPHGRKMKTHLRKQHGLDKLPPGVQIPGCSNGPMDEEADYVDAQPRPIPGLNAAKSKVETKSSSSILDKGNVPQGSVGCEIDVVPGQPNGVDAMSHAGKSHKKAVVSVVEQDTVRGIAKMPKNIKQKIKRNAMLKPPKKTSHQPKGKVKQGSYKKILKNAITQRSENNPKRNCGGPSVSSAEPEIAQNSDCTAELSAVCQGNIDVNRRSLEHSNGQIKEEKCHNPVDIDANQPIGDNADMSVKSNGFQTVSQVDSNPGQSVKKKIQKKLKNKIQLNVKNPIKRKAKVGQGQGKVVGRPVKRKMKSDIRPKGDLQTNRNGGRRKFKSTSKSNNGEMNDEARPKTKESPENQGIQVSGTSNMQPVQSGETPNQNNQDDTKSELQINVPPFNRPRPPVGRRARLSILPMSALKPMEVIKRCDICREEFKDQRQLYDHIVRVHSTEVYSCRPCSRKFGSVNAFKAHIRRKLHKKREKEFDDYINSLHK